MATITQIVDVLDSNGRPILTLPFSNYVLTRVLAAGVAESFTVPAGAAVVVFSSNGDFYANARGTAAVPAADVTDGSASELNPTSRACTPGGTISVISPYATIVTAAFYAKTP